MENIIVLVFLAWVTGISVVIYFMIGGAIQSIKDRPKHRSKYITIESVELDKGIYHTYNGSYKFIPSSNKFVELNTNKSISSKLNNMLIYRLEDDIIKRYEEFDDLSGWMNDFFCKTLSEIE